MKSIRIGEVKDVLSQAFSDYKNNSDEEAMDGDEEAYERYMNDSGIIAYISEQLNKVRDGAFLDEFVYYLNNPTIKNKVLDNISRTKFKQLTKESLSISILGLQSRIMILEAKIKHINQIIESIDHIEEEGNNE